MLDWLERHSLLLFLAAAVLLVAGVAVRQLEAVSSRPALVFNEGAVQPDGTPIRVHVAGAVIAPGVYDLRAGDRVVDALAAAGGPGDDADLEAVNLARRLRDGEKLTIPGARSQPALPLPPGARLDVNTASQAQLMLLPGIGEAYSRRIVDSRRVDGPFRSVEELVSRRVLPQATFERIRDLITVTPP